MSAPVAPVAPVVPADAAPTPAPDAAPSAPRSVEDVMASLTAPNPEYPGEAPPVIIQPPSDAAPEGAADAVQPEVTDSAEVPGDAPATDPETATTPESEPETAPEPTFEAPDGSTFKVKGPDGKYTNIPTDLGRIEFAVKTPSGEVKTYAKSPGELVAMARRAVGSEQVIERVKSEAEMVRSEAEQAASLNQSFLDLMREVFSDDSGQSWAARREEFLQMTGPEARAQRAESELQRIRRETADAAAQQQGMQWYAQRVEPAVARAFNEAPDVSVEAKMGKLNLLTAHLTVNGVVPPENREAFADIVNGAFVAWTAQEQARMAEWKSLGQRKEQEAAEARRKAQQAVNQASRPMATAGRAAPDVPARPKPKNINQALDFVIKGA